MDALTKSLLIPLGTNGAVAFKRGSVIAYHANGIADVLIRIGSGAYYTHVAVALGDGTAICSFPGVGVCIMNDGAMASVVCDARMYPEDAEVLIERMVSERGKPYDFLGLMGDPLFNWFGYRLRGGSPNTFHCSSLIAYSSPHLTWDKPYRAVTPQDVFNAVNH